MHFAILYAEVILTLGMVTTRVHYVPSGSFTSHRVKLSDSTVRQDLQFIADHDDLKAYKH